MKKTSKKAVVLTIASAVALSTLPVHAEWVNTNGTWNYVREDGQKATNWLKIENCWYAFDETGKMKTGWIASNEHWYFLGSSGVMQTNTWVDDGNYFIKGTGVMAKNYIKDGYELQSNGQAVKLEDTKSMVLTNSGLEAGTVVEGNLYVNATAAKEIELKGIEVKGKLVVLGDNVSETKISLIDTKVSEISSQQRNTEIVLSGETVVDAIVLEETANILPDKDYKGIVNTFEVQSTTKGEIKIEVPTEYLSTRTYASVDIQAPIENLEVKSDTNVKINADIKNVVVNETAKGTKVDVSKGIKVETIKANTAIEVTGKGTVNKIEANSDGVEVDKETIIKDVVTGEGVTEAPEVNKPSADNSGQSGSGSGSGGGSSSENTDQLTLALRLLNADNIQWEENEATTAAKANQSTVHFNHLEHTFNSILELQSYVLPNTTEESKRWLGVIIDTNEASLIGLEVNTGDNWYAFKESDVAEAERYGLKAGEFVYWFDTETTKGVLEKEIKARKIGSTIETAIQFTYTCSANKAKDIANMFTTAASQDKLTWELMSDAYSSIYDLESTKDVYDEVVQIYKGIKKVDLSNKKIHDYNSFRMFDILTGLEELNLSNTGIGTDDNLAISKIAKIETLKALDLSSNPLANEKLQELSKLVNLTSFNVSKTNLSDLSVVANMKSLTDLNVSQTKITNFDVFKNATKENPVNLMKLEASSTTTLVSIEGLATLVAQLNVDDKYSWNLSGIVLPEDQSNHIETIATAFKDKGIFKAPSIKGDNSVKNIHIDEDNKVAFDVNPDVDYTYGTIIYYCQNVSWDSGKPAYTDKFKIHQSFSKRDNGSVLEAVLTFQETYSSYDITSIEVKLYKDTEVVSSGSTSSIKVKVDSGTNKKLNSIIVNNDKTITFKGDIIDGGINTYLVLTCWDWKEALKIQGNGEYLYEKPEIENPGSPSYFEHIKNHQEYDHRIIIRNLSQVTKNGENAMTIKYDYVIGTFSEYANKEETKPKQVD